MSRIPSHVQRCWAAALCLFFFLPLRAHACPKVASSPWFTQIDFPEVEEVLASAPVKKQIPLREYFLEQGWKWNGSDHAEDKRYIVDFGGGVSAIFKPENELWASVAEVGSYRFAQFLDLPYVPPTVIRTIKKQKGSLQFWVPNLNNTIGYTEYYERWAELPSFMKSDIEVFHFTLGQWDRHRGNLPLDEAGYPALVDHEAALSLMKVRYGERAYIARGLRDTRGNRKGAAFPFDSPNVIQLPMDFEEFRFQLRGVNRRRLEAIYKNSNRFPDGKIHWAHWNNRVWVQIHEKFFKRAYTEVFSRDTIAKLNTLTADHVRRFYREMPIGERRRLDFLERRDQVVDAANQLQNWLD